MTLDHESTPFIAAYSSRAHSFIVGIMTYWEAVASFLTDQPLDVISYLDPFLEQKGMHRVYPNPWSGICTSVFIHLAKAGILSRQKNSLRRLSVTGMTREIRDQLHANLVEQARETEKSVLCYQVPTQDRIEDTGDVFTPIHHLQQIAQIYRLSVLLELYRVFPELLCEPSVSGSFMNTPGKVMAIATGILTIIQTIPLTSRVNCLLTIPLLIAGSTLQQQQRPTRPRASFTACTREPHHSWDSLATELLSISSKEQVCLHWRNVAWERLKAVHNYVGMAVVYRALEILEKVWDRADFRAIADESCDQFVQWTDVMTEEKLETILG